MTDIFSICEIMRVVWVGLRSHQFDGSSPELPLVPLVRLHDVGLQRVDLRLCAGVTLTDGFHQQFLSGLHLRHERNTLKDLLHFLDSTEMSVTLSCH